MEDSTAATPLSPEQELLAAQEKLQKAKARLAEAEKLRLGALQAQVAALAAERERKAAEERAERARIEEMWAERRQKERDEEIRLQRIEAERTSKLQREVAAQEEIIQKQKAHEAALQRIANEAAALEAQSNQAIAEAQKSLAFADTGVSQTVQVDGTEDAAHVRHPLSKFFNQEELVVPVQDGIDSVSQAKSQMVLDNMAEGFTPTYAQQPAPEPEAAPKKEGWHPVMRSVKNRFVSSSTSYLIETEVKRLFRMQQVNAQKCDLLSADWEEADTLEAIKRVAQETQGKPIAHDYIFMRINSLLEGQCGS